MVVKVNRFLWVLSPAGKLHVKFGNSSEGPAECGTFVRKGWKIIRGYERRGYAQCIRCTKP